MGARGTAWALGAEQSRADPRLPSAFPKLPSGAQILLRRGFLPPSGLGIRHTDYQHGPGPTRMPQLCNDSPPRSSKAAWRTNRTGLLNAPSPAEHLQREIETGISSYAGALPSPGKPGGDADLCASWEGSLLRGGVGTHNAGDEHPDPPEWAFVLSWESWSHPTPANVGVRWGPAESGVGAGAGQPAGTLLSHQL